VIVRPVLVIVSGVTILPRSSIYLIKHALLGHLLVSGKLPVFVIVHPEYVIISPVFVIINPRIVIVHPVFVIVRASKYRYSKELYTL